jgi:hypothetical protein
MLNAMMEKFCTLSIIVLALMTLKWNIFLSNGTKDSVLAVKTPAVRTMSGIIQSVTALVQRFHFLDHVKQTKYGTQLTVDAGLKKPLPALSLNFVAFMNYGTGIYANAKNKLDAMLVIASLTSFILTTFVNAQIKKLLGN